MYFDFHLHPVFKNFLTKYEDGFPTSRKPEDIINPFDLKNSITDFLDEEILHFLESQSSLSQMKDGNLKLGIAAIAPIEFAFASSEGFFSKVLNSRFFTRPLDVKHIEAIREGQVSYYRQFLKELELYHLLHTNGVIEFLSRKKHTTIPANGKPVLAMSMEGGHALHRLKTGTSGTKDEVAITAGTGLHKLVADHNGPVPLDAADSFRRFFSCLLEHDLDLFYITLTHLTNIPHQLLANHAFGFKMLKHADAFPQGFGITRQGKDLIDAAYTMKTKDTDEPLPVLIDIKHMALKSRLDLYQYRKEKNYKVPILATHMGVTGYSVNEWVEALDESSFYRDGSISNAPLVVRFTTKRKKVGRTNDLINAGLEFNPWTINMMDEDIIEVLKSGGLIGVSLDIRILGVQNILQKGEKDEFMSREEFRHFFPARYNQLQSQFTEKFVPEAMKEEAIAPDKEKKHTLMFCLNILHIVSTGLLNGITNPWNQICIGSDFDGLIDPVKNCRTTVNLRELESSVNRWMKKAEEIYMDENAGPELLPRDDDGKVETDKMVKLIRSVMYDNGKHFIEKWLSLQFKP